MKFIIFFACACACAMSAAHASEYTITVNDADRDITAEELFAITNAESEVTRVVKAGAKALNLLVPMPDYRGPGRSPMVNCASTPRLTVWAPQATARTKFSSTAPVVASSRFGAR